MLSHIHLLIYIIQTNKLILSIHNYKPLHLLWNSSCFFCFFSSDFKNGNFVCKIIQSILFTKIHNINTYFGSITKKLNLL